MGRNSFLTASWRNVVGERLIDRRQVLSVSARGLRVIEGSLPRGGGRVALGYVRRSDAHLSSLGLGAYTELKSSALRAVSPGMSRGNGVSGSIVTGVRADGLGRPSGMTEVTQILAEIEQGDPLAAEKLLPLVYDELRRLAAQKLAQEKPGQTLQATALVHEAYLRLVDVKKAQTWNSRGHFFAAAAEAMRRILIDQARRKRADKRGAKSRRVSLADADAEGGYTPEDDKLLAIDDALTLLAAEDPRAAQLIQLRHFAGLSVEDAAEFVGISRSAAYEHWAYARARLRCLLERE